MVNSQNQRLVIWYRTVAIEASSYICGCFITDGRISILPSLSLRYAPLQVTKQNAAAARWRVLGVLQSYSQLKTSNEQTGTLTQTRQRAEEREA
jgi:hypothetical protein